LRCALFSGGPPRNWELSAAHFDAVAGLSLGFSSCKPLRLGGPFRNRPRAWPLEP
jgi:hypothetical protein